MVYPWAAMSTLKHWWSRPQQPSPVTLKRNYCLVLLLIIWNSDYESYYYSSGGTKANSLPMISLFKNELHSVKKTILPVARGFTTGCQGVSLESFLKFLDPPWRKALKGDKMVTGCLFKRSGEMVINLVFNSVLDKNRRYSWNVMCLIYYGFWMKPFVA